MFHKSSIPATVATSSNTATRTATSAARDNDANVNTLIVTNATSKSVDCAGQDEDDEAVDPDTCWMNFGRYEDDVLKGVGV